VQFFSKINSSPSQCPTKVITFRENALNNPNRTPFEIAPSKGKHDNPVMLSFFLVSHTKHTR